MIIKMMIDLISSGIEKNYSGPRGGGGASTSYYERGGSKEA